LVTLPISCRREDSGLIVTAVPLDSMIQIARVEVRAM
jgi:hypothetical protein